MLANSLLVLATTVTTAKATGAAGGDETDLATGGGIPAAG
jgi:hypothetical protein